MAVEEYGAMFLVVGISAIVGFIIGKITTNAQNNKKIGQRITSSEIEQWKINPKYATILEQKIPEKVAADELSKLEKVKASNEKEVLRIRDDLKTFIKDLTKIREESKSMTSPAAKASQIEIAISMIMSSYSELRLDAEACNDINVTHGYSKRLLNFIKNGSVKPGLSNQMNTLGLDMEIKNPFKKNLAMIASQMEGMVSENQDKMEEFFGMSAR